MTLRFFRIPIGDVLGFNHFRFCHGVLYPGMFFSWHPKLYNTVDGRNPEPPGMYKTLVDNVINYQPQLVCSGFAWYPDLA